MNPPRFETIVNGIRYSTEKAVLIADDNVRANFERQERNTFLYRTPRRLYFKILTWQGGESISLVPLDRSDAIDLYEDLPEHRVLFEDAFPGPVIPVTYLDA